MVVAVQSALKPDPVDTLIARLDDPAIAESLNTLLDHVDLLAVLMSGLSELVSRGDVITESIVDGVSELRAVGQTESGPDLGSVLDTLQRLSGLVGPLVDLLPTLERLLHSDLADPRMVDIASLASRAAMQGASTTDYPRVSGALSLLRALKDEDVSRGIGFGLAVAKGLGQQLKAADSTRAGHR